MSRFMSRRGAVSTGWVVTGWAFSEAISVRVMVHCLFSSVLPNGASKTEMKHEQTVKIANRIDSRGMENYGPDRGFRVLRSRTDLLRERTEQTWPIHVGVGAAETHDDDIFVGCNIDDLAEVALG